MNLPGIALNALFSLVLVLAPARIVKAERPVFSLIATFITLFAFSVVGGLMLAVPVTVALCLFFLWIKFAYKRQSLFILTIIMLGVYLALQLASLPERLNSNQSSLSIKVSIDSMIMAASLIALCVELRVKKGAAASGADGKAEVPDAAAETEDGKKAAG